MRQKSFTGSVGEVTASHKVRVGERHREHTHRGDHAERVSGEDKQDFPLVYIQATLPEFA